MSIRILVNGAQGKMGQLTAKTLSADTDFELAGTTNHHDDLLAAIKNSQADVVVDFTNADSVLKNTQTIIDSGARPVIGTSGLLKKDIDKLQDQCSQLKRGGIIVPNFSLGAVLLMKHAQEIAKYFPAVEIIEMHHNQKLDSPSGTAIRAAEMLANSLQSKSVSPSKLKETIPGARGATYEDIPIHAIRLPGLVAHLQVMFGGTGETLTLKHDTIDRQCFMPGVVLACKKVMGLDRLIYGLEHIL